MSYVGRPEVHGLLRLLARSVEQRFDQLMYDNGGSEGGQESIRQVGAALENLLATEIEYRRRWEPRAVKVSARGVSYTAIAGVLVDWWFETGERAWDGARPPVDLVRRALTGHTLAPRTLDHLIKAFDMHPHHGEMLWHLYCGRYG